MNSSELEGRGEKIKAAVLRTGAYVCFTKISIWRVVQPLYKARNTQAYLGKKALACAVTDFLNKDTLHIQGFD